VRLRDALDELVTDYLRHHPQEQLHVLDVPHLVTWAGAQAQRPTEPPPRAVRDHHNGAQFRLAPMRRRPHHCVLQADGRNGLRCTVCAGQQAAHDAIDRRRGSGDGR
jgi:hypothetical protein